MTDEIVVEEQKYISSKRASELTGYAQDYIGQLARKDLIKAQRIGGLWYVSEDSLRNYKDRADAYKPEPPKRNSNPSQDPETMISLDGKDYISASRAAEMTGYHQDYVGQLARGSKILSRQVGNRWYVERTGILAHKKEKDALLAAVQSEAVGIQKSVVQSRNDQDEPFYTYKTETSNLLPIANSEGLESLTQTNDHREDPETFAAEEHRVPIRVVEGAQNGGRGSSGYAHGRHVSSLSRGARSKVLLPATIAFVAMSIVLSLGYLSLKGDKLYAGGFQASMAATAVKVSGVFSRIGDLLEMLLTNEIRAQGAGNNDF